MQYEMGSPASQYALSSFGITSADSINPASLGCPLARMWTSPSPHCCSSGRLHLFANVGAGQNEPSGHGLAVRLTHMIPGSHNKSASLWPTRTPLRDIFRGNVEPAGHIWYALQLSIEDVFLQNDPGGQGLSLVEPAGQYEPVEHSTFFVVFVQY